MSINKDEQAKKLEDFCVWAAYQGGKPNIQLLKESVGECIQMTVQKSSGQHSGIPKTHLNWENWERARMSVIAEAIKLVRSGLLDGLEEKEISEKPATHDEYPTWDFYFKKNKCDYQKEDSIFNNMKPRNMRSCIPSLIEHVKRLETMPMMEEWKREPEKNAILCEAAALVLSGILEEITQEEKT